MIITDEELEDAQAQLATLCGPFCEVCIAKLPPKEDLIKDLVAARAQIKVLESNKCCC